MIIDQKNWNSLIADTQLPFWHIGTTRYNHKIQALSDAKFIGDIGYDCFHSALDVIDWSREPTQSYHSLCMERARAIRDQYSWVRLWYSGGVDSHTALMSFYHAGCWPDEVINMRWSGMDLPNNPMNIENDFLVSPSLQHLAKIFPRTKFWTVHYEHDWFGKNCTADWDLYLFKHEFNSPFGRSIALSHDICPKLMKPYDRHLVGNVTGEAKPVILKRNNTWWSVVIDAQIMSMHGIPGLEMFHLTPTMPELFVKQCHMLKKDFETRCQDLTESEIWQLNQEFDRKNRALQRFNPYDRNHISARQWQHGKRSDTAGDLGFNVLADRFFDKETAFYRQHYIGILEQELWTPKSQFFPTGNLVKNGVGIFSHFWCLDYHAVVTVNDLFPTGFDL